MVSPTNDDQLTPLDLSERFWRQVLLNPNARAASFAADIRRRPLEVPMVKRRQIEKVRIGSLVALSLLASLFMVNAVVEGLVVMALISGFLLVLVAIIALIVVAASRMEWHASWLTDRVQVRDRRWGKLREWSAPFGEFERVAVRKLLIAKPSAVGVRLPTTYHLGELLHSDPLKTVLIASTKDSAKAEQAARAAAEALALPLHVLVDSA